MSGGNPRCEAITASGTRCKRIALEGQDHCYSHSSERAQERRENAAAGGRARRSPDELEQAKREIRAVTMGVLNGRVDRGVGGTVIAGFNIYLRAIEIQRKLDHQQALEDRLLTLEDELERRRRTRTWPAT